jgi:hypothetical protein
MPDVFCLEPENDFPEIYGLISSLPPWKMCYVLSKKNKIELMHEDVSENALPPIQLVDGSSFISFDRYVWFNEEFEQFIHLIQNKVVANVSINNADNANTLFALEETKEQTYMLLNEWKQVDYLIRTEGCEDFFNPFSLKEEKGVRMVLQSNMDQFKNYDKII